MGRLRRRDRHGTAGSRRALAPSLAGGRQGRLVRPSNRAWADSRKARRGTEMNGQVSWVFEVAVKPGKIDALRTLMEEMVESTRAEPGALVYEWFVSDDGGVVLLYE